MIGGIFHHLLWGSGGKNSQSQVELKELIGLNNRLEIIRIKGWDLLC